MSHLTVRRRQLLRVFGRKPPPQLVVRNPRKPYVVQPGRLCVIIIYSISNFQAVRPR